jgi:26S proteasome regulatory subunit N13
LTPKKVSIDLFNTTYDPSLLYLDLHHFCWKSQSSPDLEDFLIIPGDCQLIRHDAVSTGRVFMLKFSSSSQRQFYWLQEKSEGPNEEPGFWSQRDIDWIEGINKILQGEDAVDEEMGDPPVQSDEIEHEGEQPRRGGEDGGRA